MFSVATTRHRRTRAGPVVAPVVWRGRIRVRPRRSGTCQWSSAGDTVFDDDSRDSSLATPFLVRIPEVAVVGDGSVNPFVAKGAQNTLGIELAGVRVTLEEFVVLVECETVLACSITKVNVVHQIIEPRLTSSLLGSSCDEHPTGYCSTLNLDAAESTCRTTCSALCTARRLGRRGRSADIGCAPPPFSWPDAVSRAAEMKSTNYYKRRFQKGDFVTGGKRVPERSVRMPMPSRVLVRCFFTKGYTNAASIAANEGGLRLRAIEFEGRQLAVVCSGLSDSVNDFRIGSAHHHRGKGVSLSS